MKSKNTFAFLIVPFLIPIAFIGQEHHINTNVFVRTPQIVNYNFERDEIGYAPFISVGGGISHKSKFIELATFINDADVYGFYTFFGTTIKTRAISESIRLFTNWFGEVTYVPKLGADPAYFIYTTGLCYVLNRSFEWGSIGIPLCVGIAYSDNEFSLNTRTILNLSINLN